MKRLALAIMLWVVGASAALAQPVTVIGPITPGDCTMFSSTTVIKDAGITCGGGGAGVPGGANGTIQFNSSGIFGGFTASGDATINTGTGAVSITANAVTNAKAAQAGAATIKGNPTASTANVQDFTVQGLSNLASPNATLDLIPIWNHTTGTIQNVTPSVIGGVTSFNTRTGAVVPANGDYTAAQVTYSPLGTGAVATTDKAELDRTIWVNDYGAVCNGSTDDSTAFQNAINQGQTSGRPVRFLGNCAITTGLSITAPLDFSGLNSGSNNTQSKITVGSVSIVGITITTTTTSTSAVYLHDFGMSYSSAANSGIAAISVTSAAANENNGSRFDHLWLNGNLNHGIDFIKASGWTLSNSSITATATGLDIQNTNNGDSGDSTAYGNFIQAGNGGNAVVWRSSGGFRFENNKILGTTMAAGFFISLANGVSTSDIFIVGNSIEGIATSSPGISIARAGATGGLNHVMISNNEIAGGNTCVSMNADSASWMINLNIHGNNCQSSNGTTAFGFFIGNTSANGMVISNNSIYFPGAGSNTPVSVGTGFSATNCVIGPNSLVVAGTHTNSVTGSCATITPFL